MSWPTFDARMTADLSITTIFGGGVGAADVPNGISAIRRAAPMALLDAKNFVVMVLKSRTCGEVDDLRPIIIGLDERHTEIDLDRPERRLPADRQARGRPQSQVIFDGTSSGGLHISRTKLLLVVDVAQCAEIAEQREVQAIVFGQEARQPELRRADDIDVAAQRSDVLIQIRAYIPRSDAGEIETAERIAAPEEPLIDRRRLPE